MGRSILALALFGISSFAQGTLTPIAGKDFVFPRQGGPALQMPLGRIISVAADVQGNIYALDEGNRVVVKITPAGALSVVAGNGQSGNATEGAPALSSPLSFPSFIGVDGAGHLYISEGQRIAVVDSSGALRTAVSFQNGGSAPGSFYVDASGAVYAATGPNQANGQNCVVIRYGPSGATVVAGNGTCAYASDGSPATSISLWNPGGVTMDSAGNLYIGDGVGIRKVDPSGRLTTIAQNQPIRGFLAFDASGNFYSTGLFHEVVKFDSKGVLTTIAGGRNPGFAGDGGPADSALLFSPQQVVLDAAGNLYVADSDNYRVRRIRLGATPTIETVAGNGRYRSDGDGGAATDASLFGPFSMLADRSEERRVGKECRL